MIKKKSYWILMLTAICILAVTGCKKEEKAVKAHGLHKGFPDSGKGTHPLQKMAGGCPCDAGERGERQPL